MSGREELIEEAAKAICAFEDGPEFWRGWMDHARAALAVFEKAHAPTDEEREALIARLGDEVEYRVRTAVALAKGGHGIGSQVTEGRASVARIAAGFRRSEVPEPQDEPSDAGVGWFEWFKMPENTTEIAYVFTDANRQPSVYECAKALKNIGITEWGRIDFEPLHFDHDALLSYGHHEKAEKLYGFRFVDVVRPEGMESRGWQS